MGLDIRAITTFLLAISAAWSSKACTLSNLLGIRCLIAATIGELFTGLSRKAVLVTAVWEYLGLFLLMP